MGLAVIADISTYCPQPMFYYTSGMFMTAMRGFILVHYANLLFYQKSAINKTHWLSNLKLSLMVHLVKIYMNFIFLFSAGKINWIISSAIWSIHFLEYVILFIIATVSKQASKKSRPPSLTYHFHIYEYEFSSNIIDMTTNQKLALCCINQFLS